MPVEASLPLTSVAQRVTMWVNPGLRHDAGMQSDWRQPLTTSTRLDIRDTVRGLSLVVEHLDRTPRTMKFAVMTIPQSVIGSRPAADSSVVILV